MKRFKAIIHLILPYISIIILTMVSIGYLGGRLVASYQERIIEKKQMNLEVSIERFQARLDNITQVAYNLEKSQILRDYVYSTLNDESVPLTACMEVQKELSRFRYNPNIRNLYVFDPNTNRIIAVNTIVSDAEDYFRYHDIADGVSEEERVDRLSDSSYEGFSPVISKDSVHMTPYYIEYRIKVPVSLNSDSALQLVLVMNAKELFRDFYDVMDDESEFYVYDEEGCLIYACGKEYEDLIPVERFSEWNNKLAPIAGEEGSYGAVYETEDDKWYVKIICPDFMNVANETLPYFGTMVVVPAVLAVLLSIYFTFINYREINSLLQMLNIHFGNDNVNGKKASYTSIKEDVARLVDENSRYRERIRDYSSTHRIEVWGKLIRKAFGSTEEVHDALEEINFNYWDLNCVVLCIRYEGSDYRKIIEDNVNIKDLVKEAIYRISERNTEVFDSAARETVCILFIDNSVNSEAMVRKLIARLNVDIFYTYDVEAQIGAGNLVDSVYEAADSYTQAKEVIKYREAIGNNVYLYSDLQQLEDTCYYPAEFDELIYNYIVAGKTASAKDILSRLYSENMERKDGMLSVAAVEMLKKRLEACMVSVAKKYHISAEKFLADCQQEQNICKYFDLLYYYIDWIAEEIGDDREGCQNQLAVKIMDYINRCYSDNGLSLKHIAKEFGFQENYVSRIFKNMYGENLSVVIERIRIDRACELLKSEKMKINDISIAVGYSSDISFRRAFKKVIGMTPQEYRDAKQGSQKQEGKE